MSSSLRRVERNAVKHNILKDGRSVKRCFEKEWEDYRKNKYTIKDEDDNVVSCEIPRNTMKKKQNHFDNVEQYNRLFSYMENLRNSVETSEEEKEVEE